MSLDSRTRTHLHRDDAPQSLALLEAIIGGERLAGFERTDTGAHVDWDELLASHLSTTEKAAVHIARGTAIVERHGGGLPSRLRGVAVEAVLAGSHPAAVLR